MLRRFLSAIFLLAALASQVTGQTITDPGFETPAQAPGKFAFAPTGSAWSFGRNAGLAGNASAFTLRNPAAPQGAQVGFIQYASTVSQTIPAWPAGSYQVSFMAAQRMGGVPQNQSVAVLIDGQPVGTVTALTSSYQNYYTPAFIVAAGSHTLGFQGLNTNGDTMFLDSIAIIKAGSVAPVASSSPFVATSGKMVGFTFTSIAGNQPATPSQILAAPTLMINGQAVGQLGTRWHTGYHPTVLFATPSNYQIRPGDVVRVTAPVAWATVSTGMVQGLDSTPCDNRAGKPILAREDVPRKLRIGINNNQAPTVSNLGFYFPLKNLKYRTGWPPSNRGPMAPLGNSYLSLSHNGMRNYLDDTSYPGMAGLWLVMWDATIPATPVKFGITSSTPDRCTITERLDLARAPPDGVGMCRVFDVQPIAGAPSADFDVSITCQDPAWAGTANHRNLWVCQPGDFDITNNQVVLDRSDPWALSRIYLDRVGLNVGSIRWGEASIGGGNPSSYPYPELLANGTDENWGELSALGWHIGYTSVGPVDVKATPWIYSPFFRQPGQSYTATLAQAVTTAPAAGTKEAWTFSDADTAPLMAGLELTADSEVCRIVGGSGQQWTVNRGSNGTTPAAHQPGPVQVSGRRPITDVLNASGGMGRSSVTGFTMASAHGRTTGNAFSCDGAGWPQVAYTDGSTANFAGFGRQGYVTGPTSFFFVLGSGTPAGAIPTQTYPLVPSQQYWDGRSYGGIPIEVAANATGRFPHADLHIHVPIDACDDLAWEIARRVLANFPAGRRVYVEYSNEPWNWNFAGFYYHSGLMGPLAVPGNPYQLAHYSWRAGQVHQIFRTVFGAAGRAGEIQGLVNCQMGSGDSQVRPHLEYGLQQGTPFDAVAIAPYWSVENTSYNASVVARLDDDQAIDVIMADLRSNPRTNNAWMNSVTSALYGFNQKHQASVKLIGYEGGIEYASPWETARNRDLIYHPQWYHAETDWIAWCQQSGMERLNLYGHAMWWGPQAWGGYHTSQQKHSRGDGLNGAARNLDWRARGKDPRVNQDLHCDAVRPQAWLDWLGTLAP